MKNCMLEQTRLSIEHREKAPLAPDVIFSYYIASGRANLINTAPALVREQRCIQNSSAFMPLRFEPR